MKRIVIKIGSQIILDDEESNSNYLNNILNEIVSLKSKGFSFTIVSSGAVALAKKHITIKKSQEGTTSSKQALSSIGQVYLMNKYKSPLAPPLVPASPFPASLILVPSSTPFGIVTDTFFDV